MHITQSLNEQIARTRFLITSCTSCVDLLKSKKTVTSKAILLVNTTPDKIAVKTTTLTLKLEQRSSIKDTDIFVEEILLVDYFIASNTLEKSTVPSSSLDPLVILECSGSETFLFYFLPHMYDSSSEPTAIRKKMRDYLASLISSVSKNPSQVDQITTNLTGCESTPLYQGLTNVAKLSKIKIVDSARLHFGVRETRNMLQLFMGSVDDVTSLTFSGPLIFTFARSLIPR